MFKKPKFDIFTKQNKTKQKRQRELRREEVCGGLKHPTDDDGTRAGARARARARACIFSFSFSAPLLCMNFAGFRLSLSHAGVWILSIYASLSLSLGLLIGNRLPLISSLLDSEIPKRANKVIKFGESVASLRFLSLCPF